MKKILLILIISVAATGATAQDRGVARGADPGELYVTSTWYMIYGPGGPPHYDSIQKALFRLTENGKKLTVQYATDYFYTNPETTPIPFNILADATPGVLYMKGDLSKNSYPYTSLWVSFDYGKNWTFREENIGRKGYFSTNVDGLVYKGDYGIVSKSVDYGESFTILENLIQTGTEAGFTDCEFYNIMLREFQYTNDCYLTCIVEKTIDEEFVGGQMGGIFPDVYRGGLPGEVYIDSWFSDSDSNPNWTYKVSFSADTGHTFQHVYINEPVDPVYDYGVTFMSDREPGVFYVIKYYDVEDTDPWGKHRKICVDYYRDYGDTFVDTYCHDITKDYKNEVGIAEPEGEDGVVVYPNPTGGILHVETHNYASLRNIDVFDVFGRNVLTAPVETHGRASLHTTPIDISYLPEGIYFVRVTTEKGIINKKIVKY